MIEISVASDLRGAFNYEADQWNFLEEVSAFLIEDQIANEVEIDWS